MFKPIKYYAYGISFTTKRSFIKYCVKHNLIGDTLYMTNGWELFRVKVALTDYGYIVYIVD